jgi:aminopeptidase 2
MGEVIILNKIFPDWRPHSSFINDHLERALQLDAQRSSHPIQVDCPDAAMINQVRYFPAVVNPSSIY